MIIVERASVTKIIEPAQSFESYECVDIMRKIENAEADTMEGARNYEAFSVLK